MRDQQHIAPPFRADGQINGQFFFGFRARPQGVRALRLGGNFLSDQERLNPFASDILDALSKAWTFRGFRRGHLHVCQTYRVLKKHVEALTDSCPDAKKECCEITKKAWDRPVGFQSGTQCRDDPDPFFVGSQSPRGQWFSCIAPAAR